MKSLTEQSIEQVLVSLGENGNASVLATLLGKMTKSEKQTLYEKLAWELHGGITLTGRYTYVIFAVGYVDRLTSDATLKDLYEYSDGEEAECAQILFISGHHETRFDCAREGPYDDPNNDKIGKFHEHPEARIIYDTLIKLDKERKANNKYASRLLYESIVVKFDIAGDDVGNYLIEHFCQGIVEQRHCGCLSATDYDETEFSIDVNGKRRLVSFREFDTESG
jgi:hypothetical protein